MSQPTLYITVSPPGHGKSFVSEQLAAQTEAAHVMADEIRKYVVVDSGNPTYSKEESQQTYGTLMQAAEHILTGGRDVVLDATFGLQEGRDEAAEVAQKRGASLSIVRVKCEEEIAKQRIRGRDNLSDAGVEYYDSFILEEPDREVTEIDNSGSKKNTIREIERKLL